jgi:hypothetical protein
MRSGRGAGPRQSRTSVTNDNNEIWDWQFSSSFVKL